jgi:hypothetical protein
MTPSRLTSQASLVDSPSWRSSSGDPTTRLCSPARPICPLGTTTSFKVSEVSTAHTGSILTCAPDLWSLQDGLEHLEIDSRSDRHLCDGPHDVSALGGPAMHEHVGTVDCLDSVQQLLGLALCVRERVPIRDGGRERFPSARLGGREEGAEGLQGVDRSLVVALRCAATGEDGSVLRRPRMGTGRGQAVVWTHLSKADTGSAIAGAGMGYALVVCAGCPVLGSSNEVVVKDEAPHLKNLCSGSRLLEDSRGPCLMERCGLRWIDSSRYRTPSPRLADLLRRGHTRRLVLALSLGSKVSHVCNSSSVVCQTPRRERDSLRLCPPCSMLMASLMTRVPLREPWTLALRSEIPAALATWWM